MPEKKTTALQQRLLLNNSRRMVAIRKRRQQSKLVELVVKKIADEKRVSIEDVMNAAVQVASDIDKLQEFAKSCNSRARPRLKLRAAYVTRTIGVSHKAKLDLQKVAIQTHTSMSDAYNLVVESTFKMALSDKELLKKIKKTVDPNEPWPNPKRKY